MLTNSKSEISILKEMIFNTSDSNEFTETTLRVFYYQYHNNLVYRQFCDLLHKNPSNVNRLESIPFIPVQFFKDHKIYSAACIEEKIFTSSGTSGTIPSRHYVADLDLYERAFIHSFSQFYGNYSDYVVFALLPSYLEREGSSLIYMADFFIKNSKHSQGGFFLYNHDELIKSINEALRKQHKILLLGVTYALLDLAENYKLDLTGIVIMETGGMKGKRQELLREEVHDILKNAFKISHIHSEYGMTELMSQAYSKGDGIFKCPSQMKVMIREMNDPFSFVEKGRTGGINIIDLANLYSCSFISTMDLGKIIEDESFTVSGRFDQSEIRGCNLLVQ